MATIKQATYQTRQFGGFSPFGNNTSLNFGVKTDATGKVIGAADGSAAPAIGDVIDLGQLPQGWRLEDATVYVTTGMTAAVTGSLGFAYEDGVNDAAVPQDAAYFGAALNLAAAARLRATGSKLVVLPKTARLIFTIAGAANAKASDIQVIVSGELQGPR